jgi:SpoVK/Ycf46/Vps4 family AAA+-type ATPase
MKSMRSVHVETQPLKRWNVELSLLFSLHLMVIYSNARVANLRNIDITADPTSRILVIGATNRIDSIDPSLRRSGRFDRELSLQVPDEKSRVMILKIHTKPMKLEANFNYLSIARKTPGYAHSVPGN